TARALRRHQGHDPTRMFGRSSVVGRPLPEAAFVSRNEATNPPLVGKTGAPNQGAVRENPNRSHPATRSTLGDRPKHADTLLPLLPPIGVRTAAKTRLHARNLTRRPQCPSVAHRARRN